MLTLAIFVPQLEQTLADQMTEVQNMLNMAEKSLEQEEQRGAREKLERLKDMENALRRSKNATQQREQHGEESSQSAEQTIEAHTITGSDTKNNHNSKSKPKEDSTPAQSNPVSSSSDGNRQRKGIFKMFGRKR